MFTSSLAFIIIGLVAFIGSISATASNAAYCLLWADQYCSPTSTLVTQPGTYASPQACANQCASSNSNYEFFVYVAGSSQCECTLSCTANVITNPNANIYGVNRGCTAAPTYLPTATPTARPTAIPTAIPTARPTAIPTAVPTASPTNGYHLCWSDQYCLPTANLKTQVGTYASPYACALQCIGQNAGYNFFAYLPSYQQCECSVTCNSLYSNPSANTYAINSQSCTVTPGNLRLA